MVKFFLILLLIAGNFAFAPSVHAQLVSIPDSTKPKKIFSFNRFSYFEINTGLLSGFSAVKFSPSLIYQANRYFAAGVGLSGIFAVNGFLNDNKGYFGLHALARTGFQIGNKPITPNWIYLQMRPELNYVFSAGIRKPAPSILLGIGNYIYSPDRKLGIGANVDYDLLNDNNSPYVLNNKWIYNFNFLFNF